MQQYCQLSRHGHYRSLLGIFPSSLRKLRERYVKRSVQESRGGISKAWDLAA
jgi:hypothetical protein